MLYQEKFSRNFPTLNEKQQEKVCNSLFCVIGLGGTGGFALECLARLGAERFIIFDHDKFELSNFNRQLMAERSSLGVPKINAAITRLYSINNEVKVKRHSGRFDSKSATAIANCDVVLDCTDSIATKQFITESCRSYGVQDVFCSAGGSRGIVTVFAGYPFAKAFQVDDAKKSSRTRIPAICPSASLAGTLAASQALNLTIGKPCIRAPHALFFDIFDRRLFWKARLG